MNMKNKVAIVTGGASGLGRATAEAFVSAGAKVAIFDLDEDAGESLSESLGEAAIFCNVNVADDAMIEAGMDRVMQVFGAIHVCVNCAGRGGGATKTLGRRGRFPMELFRDVININLVGTFNVLTRAAEKMSLNEPDENGDRGVIVNTASIAAYEGQKGQVAYAASKGGIVSLTLPVARDLAYFGIRVVTVAPGIFDTPILQGISDEVRDGLASSIPHPPRLGDVNDFSALVQHIVTNPYINGETIRLDGGLRMS
jgi:3-hydroxyacyl-CoA dehydrogenase/3-hydroxy-2-methylbutyryl-CoA dehydrogenase